LNLVRSLRISLDFGWFSLIPQRTITLRRLPSGWAGAGDIRGRRSSNRPQEFIPFARMAPLCFFTGLIHRIEEPNFRPTARYWVFFRAGVHPAFPGNLSAGQSPNTKGPASSPGTWTQVESLELARGIPVKGSGEELRRPVFRIEKARSSFGNNFTGRGSPGKWRSSARTRTAEIPRQTRPRASDWEKLGSWGPLSGCLPPGPKPLNTRNNCKPRTYPPPSKHTTGIFSKKKPKGYFEGVRPHFVGRTV